VSNKVWLDDTEHWQLESSIMEYTYDVKVSIPKERPSEKGFPVYYLLDGNSYFQHGRDIIRLQSRNTPKTFIPPAIVIGVGHHGDDEEVRKRRFYDFTPSAKQYKYPERLNGADLGIHGGAEKFLAFMEQELMPVINQKYAINSEKQTIFGHSLSGLFVLWVLFNCPKLFPFYVASSPSIWWNDYELLKSAEQYYKKAVTHENQKLLMTVGGKEGFMVNDAKQLFSYMCKRQEEQLEVELYVAADENHASVVPTIMSRAFRLMNR
jgi:uncharacterized protein